MKLETSCRDVAHPVIDLAQHGLGAVAGEADLFLGGVVFTLQAAAGAGRPPSGSCGNRAVKSSETSLMT